MQYCVLIIKKLQKQKVYTSSVNASCWMNFNESCWKYWDQAVKGFVTELWMQVEFERLTFAKGRKTESSWKMIEMCKK